MTGSIIMIRQKTTDLKRRFAERTAERRRQKELQQQNEVKKRTITTNWSSDDSSVSAKSSTIMNFAIASSTFASSYSNSSSDDGSSKSSKTKKKHHSKLYEPSSSSQQQTRVVHPNVYKRDIYLASRTAPANSQPTKSTSRSTNSGGSGRSSNAEHHRRVVMHDISNDFDEYMGGEQEAKTNLPPYSLTGSMLCREMEEGHLRPNGTTAQQMMSPCKPVGLPSNTIMASMLFRTLQEEEERKTTSGVSLNQYGVPTKTNKKMVPREVLPSPTARSVMSEITLHSKESEEEAKMQKASKDLLSILKTNQLAFDTKPQNKQCLYEA